MLVNKRGFTLIEILIVLAILAGIITLGAPRLIPKQGTMKSVARKLMVLSKETRNRARLVNSTYRIAFKIEDKSSSFWVERASGAKLIDPNEEAEKEKNEDPETKKPPVFQPDQSVIKETSLPSDLRFSHIETINMKTPITAGMAYIYYSPEGFVEASVIQITNAKNQTWTLVINPLTGQADIVEEARSLKDLQR